MRKLSCFIRFKWSLFKTLEYLNSRRPDLEIRANFFHQLTNLEGKLIKNSNKNFTSSWNEASPDIDNDEMLLRNTFLNAKNAPYDDFLINIRTSMNLKNV